MTRLPTREPLPVIKINYRSAIESVFFKSSLTQWPSITECKAFLQRRPTVEGLAGPQRPFQDTEGGLWWVLQFVQGIARRLPARKPFRELDRHESISFDVASTGSGQLLRLWDESPVFCPEVRCLKLG